MNSNFVKDVNARLNVLKASGNDAQAICNKLNAEFSGCFYRSKQNVWMSFINESGKSDARNLGVC